MRHDRASLVCSIHGTPDSADKLLRALKAEVEKLAKQDGAKIIDSVEAKGLDGHVGGFEINYGIGNVHGKFEANIISKPDAKDRQLKIQIEEMSGS